MTGTHRQAGSAARWSQQALPWVVVLALWTGFAYAMNTSVVGALSAHPPADVSAAADGDASTPCALDADGALDVRWEWWVPAGRSAFCRGETYPGVPGRNEPASQLTRAGRILATITFLAPSDTRVDLYCPVRSQQSSTDARFVSAAEARSLYEQVCTPAGSSD